MIHSFTGEESWRIAGRPCEESSGLTLRLTCTLLFSAHEYTESNARFALSVEPSNADLQARAKEVRELRAKGEATIPSLLGLEKKTNPFLRVDVSEEIRSNCGVVQEDDDATAFAKVRRAKDRF